MENSSHRTQPQSTIDIFMPCKLIIFTIKDLISINDIVLASVNSCSPNEYSQITRLDPILAQSFRNDLVVITRQNIFMIQICHAR